MTKFNKIAYFGQIPPKVMKKLTKSAAVVLMLIYDYSNGDGGEAYASHNRLMEGFQRHNAQR
jgi:hypothetical protein